MIPSRLGSSKPWSAMRSVRRALVDGADEGDGLDAGETGAHAPTRSNMAQPRMSQRAGAVGIAESKERRLAGSIAEQPPGLRPIAARVILTRAQGSWRDHAI